MVKRKKEEYSEGEEENTSNTLSFKKDLSNKDRYKRPKSIKQITDALPLNHSYLTSKAPISFLPKRKYCDITGLETIHTDPKSNLNFYNSVCYQYISQLSPNTIQAYLQIRNAAVILK